MTTYGGISLANYARIPACYIDTSRATHTWKGRSPYRAYMWDWGFSETLYRLHTGRYCIVYSAGVEGCTEVAEYISRRGAVSWLLHNGYDAPTGTSH